MSSKHKRSESVGGSPSTSRRAEEESPSSYSMWYSRYGSNEAEGGDLEGGEMERDMEATLTACVTRLGRGGQKEARRGCFKWRASKETAAALREEGFAPLADQPPTDGSLEFKYLVDDMMRVVYEGAGVKKIARYNEQKLVRYGWMKRKVYRTTFLASSYGWLQIFFLYGLTGFVAAMVFTLLKAVGANDRTVESLQSGLEISSTIEIFVAFLLGSFIKKTIDIWWELRHDTLQQLMNVIADMCLRMAIYFPGKDYEDRHARETIMRYGILSLALLFQDAKKVDIWKKRQARGCGVLNLDHLQRDKLLTSREAALLHNVPAKSQMCWVWISSLFTKWCLDGRLPDPLGNQNSMLQYSEEARNAISTILAQLTMQFPLSYSYLIVFFCKVYMGTLAVEAGVTAGSSLLQGQTNYATLLTKCFALTVSPIVYQGLLELKERVSNPFRNNMQDYSLKMFHARLRNECTGFFKCAMEPPYTTPEDPEPSRLPPQFIERQVNTAMYDFDVY
ncbi:hypothetical protein HOP50_20g86640 [Chloropicon primus]|uniref:Uncharacterized protein n=1 Tax=Chloropicon primus TaxID=1764295 RepID=A0A5B8MZK2_9CHLO|nr:hypothetical protein A3770_20p86150 [Chloropicon primus]UPR05314.1 hypothetical protein HOP50_20g86640 [Chloropicon primus]|mmetsp:Transcript_5344/g.16149  ORF Transcript_5344/g.16149 Transcript_5344/m.16149 type:complete len:506 (+) Transcript_5344:665-2182(+)|eukprot:QDZ26097.1 hypothetical protein A3770_20p86150 [Chloropicon primus]